MSQIIWHSHGRIAVVRCSFWHSGADMYGVALKSFKPKPFDIKTWVSWLGLALTALVALGGPLIKLSVVTSTLSSELTFRAELSATRAAKYIHAQGPLWVHHTVRLADVIQLPGNDRTRYKQSLLNTSGTLVVDEDHKIAWPAIERMLPVLVNGETVGELRIATSLREPLANSAPIVLSCLFLAAATFLGLRVLPLAGLTRTLAELDTERQAIAAVNEKLELALNNTSHGLVLYDRSGDVVVSNDRLLKLYRSSIVDTGSLPSLGQLTQWLGVHDRCAAFVGANGTLDCTTDLHIHDIECRLDDGRVLSLELRTVPAKGVLVTIKDVTDQHRAQSQITYLASSDTLTGLANRATLQQTLTRHLNSCSSASMVALMLIDLDRFKAVNDTLGHPVGDELLRQVATRLRESVRRNDLVSRLGGDEFAIVLSGLEDLDEVHVIARRVLEQLALPYETSGHRVHVTCSIGVAMAPADSSDQDILFKKADIALYASKSGGRRTYRFFQVGMDEVIAKRHQMENDLRLAIEEQQFALNYQPLFGLGANRIEGFEALLRWKHPVRGIVSPADFVPLAEETGLIKDIGAWALEQACTDAATWPDDIGIAVNLSSVQFGDNSLVTLVKDVLERTGLEPKRLELEITESIILQDTETTLDILRDLKALGTRISMDDFGTGYSSLSYLQKFPFDKIKIDRAFIDGINNKSDSLAIVRAVTSMSRSLGMATTGEGVETQAELDCLRAEGCTQAQGYLISRPIPASAIPHLIQSTTAIRLAA